MVEIAISLAIIGIALVAILGVLPLGMRTQKDVREETIINQDATVLMEDIRNGAKGANDLTNYIYAITNTWEIINPKDPGAVIRRGTYGYTYSGFYPNPTLSPPPIYSTHAIDSGTNIIGLLTTPELQNLNGTPNPVGDAEYYSNHIVAYVRSISGPAVEKPPQDSGGVMQQSSFAYRLIVQNVPVPMAPPGNTAGVDYNYNVQANLYELRLYFRWPQQPNGSLGPGAHSFRTMVAGQLATDGWQTNLYFFQSQAFTGNTDITAEGGGP
ncbi:MAG TPA: hypothetical protein VGN23_04315 [Verrucomicrobiae bacterium]|jgi:type II secretory pathway pseudopilin PulG